MKWCMGLEAVMEIIYLMTISVIYRTDQAFCGVALMDSSFHSEHLLHQSENWLILSCSLIVVFTESAAEGFLPRIKWTHPTRSRLDLPAGGYLQVYDSREYREKSQSKWQSDLGNIFHWWVRNSIAILEGETWSLKQDTVWELLIEKE